MDHELLGNIYKTLRDAGFELPRDGRCLTDNICIVDPTCIWTPLLSFIHDAWIVLTVSTGILLAGWGITMLRGANHNIVKNLRTLVLIFGVLSATLPILQVLGGKQLLIDQCETITLSQQEVAALVETANKQLHKANYESFEILDSNYGDF